jgi:predicted Fe-Mo cluster-binding NifX family protein
MIICFPIHKDLGLKSPVHQHFGAAPVLMIIDSEEGSVKSFYNKDFNHLHGSCDPIKALGGEVVDVIIAGVIGGGALMRLRTEGIRVLKAEGVTVEDNIVHFFDRGLPEFISGETCSAHGNGGDCCSH